MSMPNLLPWRRQQRNQRLRFWGLLFTASLLVMLAGGVSLSGDADSRVTGGCRAILAGNVRCRRY